MLIRFSEQQLLSKVTSSSCLFNSSTRLFHWEDFYNKFLGWNEVRDAQNEMENKENLFIDARNARRFQWRKLSKVQQDLNAVRIEIGRFSRDQPQYLVLFQKEHQLIKEEKPIQEELEKCEKSEKKAFHEFQAARQTTRVEEKKYSAITRYRIVIGHLIAFIFGLFVATDLNQRSTRHGNTMSAEYEPIQN